MKELITQFSLVVPDKNMLPIAKLNKGIIKVVRNLDEGSTNYEPVQGNVNLRRRWQNGLWYSKENLRRMTW